MVGTDEEMGERSIEVIDDEDECSKTTSSNNLGLKVDKFELFCVDLFNMP